MDIAEGVQLRHIYWVRGETPKGSSFRNVVKDPPCSGWQHVVVIEGEKRSTLLCPFTLQAYTVPNSCDELRGTREPRVKGDPREFVVRALTDKWKECQGFGWHRDYDTVALVLRRLDAEVPAQVRRGGEEDQRRKGGKDVESVLKKPVKLKSKRGKFLAWFLDGGGSQSVREAMAEFGMSRSNALSYLYMLQKDHGIGYVLVGDVATVQLPEGCVNPFDEQWGPEPLEDDESWLE